MQKIVVPTDFTAHSRHAVVSAQKLAARSKGSVTLLYVKGKNESEDIGREKIESFIAENESPYYAPEHIISDGDPVDAVITSGGDIIIMGSKGAKGLKSFFIGTNAEKVAKRALCPVIVVKDEVDLGAVKSIVFPTDMRKEQGEIIDDVKILQAFYDAHLHLVKVYDDAVLKRRGVEDRLRAFAEQYGLTSYSVTGRPGVNEANEIMDFANEIGADLIAMATHDRTGPEKLVGGFITASVINKAMTPIWSKSIHRED